MTKMMTKRAMNEDDQSDDNEIIRNGLKITNTCSAAHNYGNDNDYDYDYDYDIDYMILLGMALELPC